MDSPWTDKPPTAFPHFAHKAHRQQGLRPLQQDLNLDFWAKQPGGVPGHLESGSEAALMTIGSLASTHGKLMKSVSGDTVDSWKPACFL